MEDMSCDLMAKFHIPWPGEIVAHLVSKKNRKQKKKRKSRWKICCTMERDCFVGGWVACGLFRVHE